MLVTWARFGTEYRDFDTIRDLLVCILEMVLLVSAHSQRAFMVMEDADRFKELVDDLLRSWQWLGQRADERMQLLFSLPPETPWLWHWAQTAQWHSPRAGACMVDEDFVGRMEEVTSSCAPGSSMETTVWGVMTKL